MLSEVPIQVAVRVRPLLGDELVTNADPSVYCIPNEPEIVIGKDRQFRFDHVFSPEASQTEVYDDCVKPLIATLFEGYNATVFAYGHTGSGKTYTMGTGNCTYLDEDERGIVPRAVTDIFEHIALVECTSICKLRVSFIEVYREETTDLLENSTKNLQIREDEQGNVVLVGVREEAADCMEDVLHLLDAGTAIRHVGSTNMNEVSSRSHCIFTLIMDQYPIEQSSGNSSQSGNVLTSRFHFVDLAGSERAHKTGNQGERFKESVFINTGLLALGNVISALSDPKRKNQHVPYRESKLTRLLKDSLGGNSRTVMITCLSCALQDLDENITSLKYATRASSIRNKPVVNWDMMATSKVSRMESEIQVLREQLQRQMSDMGTHPLDKQKISDLQLENVKHTVEHDHFLQHLHEVNSLLQAVESSVNLPIKLVEDIMNWRKTWEKSHFERPVTAPSRNCVVKRPSNDIVDNLRAEISKLKEDHRLMKSKCQDIEDLNREIIEFGEENAQLRLELDGAINNENEMREKLLEQQMIIQTMKNSEGGTSPRYNDRLGTSRDLQPEDRMLMRFRARNDLLVSQLDDMDEVEIDTNISSDEEDDDDGEDDVAEEEKPAFIFKQKSEPTMTRRRRIPSKIPRLTDTKRPLRTSLNISSALVLKPPPLDLSGLNEHDDILKDIATNRFVAEKNVKLSELHMREMNIRMKELESLINQKENLINDLAQSEKEARATNETYKDKLTKLEKEYEKSKHELEETQQKITQYENSNTKDIQQKSKLDGDYKKKLKVVQKKFDDMKHKQTVASRISTYQRNNEKKVSDLEGCISRMKNQQAELERKLKEESDVKSKYEDVVRKNELRLKELEHKTDQQQKLLKRKTEEVAAAKRKLRNSAGPSDLSRTNDVLEKKKEWIDNEIEKIITRQNEIEMLEADLRERDKSLQKKEALISEQNLLEIKRTESNQLLSKSIVQLSTQMETIDEQIHTLQQKDKVGKDLQRLQDVKDGLLNQKSALEENMQINNGLEPHEQRRLIELGEAVEAVVEAIQYKNDLITEKQSYLTDIDVDDYHKVEELLATMGNMSTHEYKHLLGKFFLKIIDLRKLNDDADETRLHFEIKVSEQEKSLREFEHMLKVIETRNEKEITEQHIKYEQEIRFLMEQLRELESETASKEQHLQSSYEKKISALEKELYYYKVKSRKYKDHLKDFTNNVSIDSSIIDSQTTPAERKSSQQYQQQKRPSGDNSAHYNDTNDFHLPPVKSFNQHQQPQHQQAGKRYHTMDPYSQEEHKRLQHIFEIKGVPNDNMGNPGSSKRHRESSQRKTPGELSYQDSIEVVGHRWEHPDPK